jgi:hypothetical protein
VPTYDPSLPCWCLRGIRCDLQSEGLVSKPLDIDIMDFRYGYVALAKLMTVQVDSPNETLRSAVVEVEP